MSSEVLFSNVIPFAGSGLLGYAMGFALKKILKWMLIIVGFLAGMFFVGVQLLQKTRGKVCISTMSNLVTWPTFQLQIRLRLPMFLMHLAFQQSVY
jgi:uncharacterized membrane protein (Fun14 family)